ncbi:hypothetical protein TKK_0015861 [Trichogramma kaykai]
MAANLSGRPGSAQDDLQQLQQHAASTSVGVILPSAAAGTSASGATIDPAELRRRNFPADVLSATATWSTFSSSSPSPPPYQELRQRGNAAGGGAAGSTGASGSGNAPGTSSSLLC